MWNVISIFYGEKKSNWHFRSANGKLVPQTITLIIIILVDQLQLIISQNKQMIIHADATYMHACLGYLECLINTHRNGNS